MRILSQDGIKFDIEYENCHLVVNEKCCEIEAETSNPNFTPVMASYSSIEKCRKAMEMLRKAYTGLPIIMRNVDIADDFAEMLKEWKKQWIVYRTENDEPSKIEVVNNGYFQFPADDEIEV